MRDTIYGNWLAMGTQMKNWGPSAFFSSDLQKEIKDKSCDFWSKLYIEEVVISKMFPTIDPYLIINKQINDQKLAVACAFTPS